MHVLHSKHNPDSYSYQSVTTAKHVARRHLSTTPPQTSRSHHDGTEIMASRISSTKRQYSCTLTLDTLHVTTLDSINGDDTRFHGRVHHKTGINSGSRIFRHLDHGRPLTQTGKYATLLPHRTYQTHRTCRTYAARKTPVKSSYPSR